MESTIEELKFVADLAHNGGMMKAQNEALSADLTKLQTELNEKKVQLMEMQVMMAKVDEITNLQGDVNRELADAIKEAANKPTTTINAANYNAHVDDQNNNFPELPPMAPASALLADE
jgi:hypothetical protein